MGYSLLSRVYQKFIGIDYSVTADFIDRVLKTRVRPEIVIDIGSGTGDLTALLSKKGYSMIAADPSPDMLAIASEKLSGTGVPLVCQSMSELDLYGTVDAAVSTTDVINHITDPGELRRGFERLSLFMVKDGIFIFDINTEYKFKNLYSNNCYYYEDGSDSLVWQNSYDPDTCLCQFDLTLFSSPDGRHFVRESDSFAERCYSVDSLKSLLNETGFELLELYGGEYQNRPPRPDDSRIVFVSQKKWQAGKISA